MKLSDHFTLEELSITQVRDVDNEPRGEVLLDALKNTAMRMEAVRSVLKDKPVLVNSGYRSPFVNKIVGGSSSSAHMSGHAVDFICPGFGSPREVALAIEASSILFDQLIWEETWVHLSFAPKMRREVLTKRRHGSFISGIRSEQKEMKS